MSYILDALRKAERDRNLGRTPSLGDVTANAARPPVRRPSPRTVALLGLVAGLLIATVLLWPRRPAPESSPPVASTPPPPVTPPQVAPPPAPPLPSSTPEVAVSPPAERTLAPDVPAESIEDLMDETDAPPDAVDVTPPTPPPQDAEVPDEPAPPASFAEAQSEPAPMDAAPVPPDVPLLRDMPSDYRGTFPALRVDVHVYDEDPARRWVMVNGRKAVEGATLGEGPTVSRITPEGIVFDFRGSRVLLPLNR